MCRIHLVLNVKIIEWCESSRQFSLLVTTGTPVEPKYTRPGAYNSQQRQVHVVVRSVQQDYESYICGFKNMYEQFEQKRKIYFIFEIDHTEFYMYNSTTLSFFFPSTFEHQSTPGRLSYISTTCVSCSLLFSAVSVIKRATLPTEVSLPMVLSVPLTPATRAKAKTDSCVQSTR
jgi:hypothetical protein